MRVTVEGVEVEVTTQRVAVDPTGDIVFVPMVGERSMADTSSRHYIQCVVHDQYHVRDLVKPGMVVLDVGASIGMFTMMATRAGARVMAFEPDPVDLVGLMALVQHMGDVDVTVRPQAVSDVDGVMRMSLTPVTGGSRPVPFGDDRLNMFSVDVSAGATAAIQCVTIDSVVEELGLDRVDMIKIDTEGWEKRVLAGARATLRRWHPILVMASYHRPEDPQVLPEVVRQIDPTYGPPEYPPLVAPECEYSIRMRPREVPS